MRDIVTEPPVRLVGRPALLILALSVLVIAAVWRLQAQGYNPCELCLKERIPYYVGIPLAAVVALAAASRLPTTAVRGGYAALGLLFAAGAALGAYHAGVEWKWWAGPTACSGAAAAPAAVNDFLQQLKTVTVVRCDEAALKILGPSLAAWNAVLSAGLVALCVAGWRRAR